METKLPIISLSNSFEHLSNQLYCHYSKCPQCREEMKFIGQVSGEDIRDYAEGIYYSFVCKKCMIAATSYQQT